MNAKHTPTPAPWIAAERAPYAYDGEGDELFIRDDDQEHPQGPFTICTVNRSRRSESEANAALIAAAPDLLEACEAVLRSTSWEDPVDRLTINEREAILKAAIAKARGPE